MTQYINEDIPIYEMRKVPKVAVKTTHVKMEDGKQVNDETAEVKPEKPLDSVKEEPGTEKSEDKMEDESQTTTDASDTKQSEQKPKPAGAKKPATTAITYMATYKIPLNARTTLLNPQTLLQIQNITKTRLKTLKKRKREQMTGNATGAPPRQEPIDSFPTLIQIESTISAQHVQHALIALAYYAKYGFTSYSKRIFVDLAGENIEPRFDLSGRLRGPKDAYLRHIESKCGVQVRLKGKGSQGELPQMPMGRVQRHPAEEDPHLMLHFHIQGSNRKNLQKAETLAESLIEKVKKDYTEFVHSKMNSYIGDFDWQTADKRGAFTNSAVSGKEDRTEDNSNGPAITESNSTTTKVETPAPQHSAESTTTTPSPSKTTSSTTEQQPPASGSKHQGTTELHSQVVRSARKHVEIDVSKVPQVDSLLHLNLDPEAKQKLGALMKELL